MAAIVGDSIMKKNDTDVPIKVIGGLGSNSYFKHSFFQKIATNVAKDIFDEAITAKLDVKSFSSTSNTIVLADLGCATGPNSFFSMQDLIDAIKQKYQTQCPSSTMPTFQVFFNDQISNDFNTLFTSVPLGREYFMAGVPGSFYERLFPRASLHVVHTSYALHWLSKLPQELEDRKSLAWNKGRIHYASASNEVVKAYASQWANDFNRFLNARAQEIVSGGMLFIVMPSIPDDFPYSKLSNGIMFNCMASVLLDMAKQGLITEEQVDAFNLPLYATPPGEFASIVQENGYFTIEEMELTNPSPWLTQDIHVDMDEFVRHIRAAWDAMFVQHFKAGIVDKLFDELLIKLKQVSQEMETAYNDKIQACYVLQRK